MTATATVQARVNPIIKQQAEEVLDALGLSTSQAISLFLSEIGRTKRVPVHLSLQSSEKVEWLSEEEDESLAQALQSESAGIVDVKKDPEALEKLFTT